MSPFVIIILIGFVIGFLYLVFRNQKLRLLNKAVKVNDVDEILRLVEDHKVQKVFSKYILDLYKAKGYFLKKDEIKLKEHLRLMFQNDYEIDDEKQYLTLYYHIFINKKDISFVDEMLERIKQCSDVSFVQHCVWTKAVLLECANDSVEAISKAIDEKQYNGFLLGSAVYMIALQRKRLGNVKEAKEWFAAALDVLRPSDFYYNEVKAECDLVEEN